MKGKKSMKRNSYRKHNTRRNSMRSKRRGNNRLSKKHMKKTQYHKKKQNRRYTKKRTHRKMKGGFNETVPFMPEGGMYQVGDINLGQGYYYGLSPDLHAPNDMIMNTSNYSLIGGKRRGHGHGRGRKLRRGGGIIPQQVLDLGRNLMNGAQHVYAGFVGDTVPASSNPNVIYQPEMLKSPEFNIEPTNVPKIMADNDSAVANGNYTLPSNEYNL